MDCEQIAPQQQRSAEVSAQQPPLFVDLDGTLITGDSLVESFLGLLRQNPLAALCGLLALGISFFKGRARFKNYIAAHYQLDAESLIYNLDVVDYVQHQFAAGRQVYLATAADAKIARAVADHLNCFSGVLASDGETNLKGEEKLAAIQRLTRECSESQDGRFDYIGDHPVDRVLWQASGQALVVAADMQQAGKIAGGTEVSRFFALPRKSWKDILRMLRVHQWVKNLLIFVPIVLAHRLLDTDKVILTVGAAVSFCLCASATYIWNDLLDLPADRLHPRKRRRPIASGVVTVKECMAWSVLLFGLSLLLSRACSPLTTLLLAGYVLLTVTYSLFLKKRLLVDVFALGCLYTYRILYGGLATAITVSDWLIAFSVFFFLGLALAKRYTELLVMGAAGLATVAGRGYRAEDLQVVGILGVVSSFMSVLILALYMTSPVVIALYSTPELFWIICLVMIYWLSRIWVMCYRGTMHDDPIVFALTDRASIVSGLVCGLVLLLSL